MQNTNLPSIHRWYSEDYSKAPDWFQRFLASLNLFSDPMYNILNGGVDVTQNTVGEFYTYTISNASQVASANTFTFTPKKFVGAPQGVFKAQIVYTSLPSQTTFYLSAPSFDWIWTGSQIKITAFYGLVPGMSYSVTLLIL